MGACSLLSRLAGAAPARVHRAWLHERPLLLQSLLPVVTPAFRGLGPATVSTCRLEAAAAPPSATASSTAKLLVLPSRGAALGKGAMGATAAGDECPVLEAQTAARQARVDALLALVHAGGSSKP